MGAKASQLGKYAGNAKDAAVTVGTHTARKVRRQGNNFMAAERAEKQLEKQNYVPVRAPMNVSKLEVTDDVRKQRMEEFEEHDKKDTRFLDMMKDVYITSKDPIQQAGSVNATTKSEDPFDGTDKEKDAETPHGRASRKTILLALYNHKNNPADWGVAEVAEKIRIRESDCKDLLENFEFLEGDSITKSDYEKVKVIPFR